MAEIWKSRGKRYPAVAENIKCGVAVVGGGLTGVILAHILSKRGLDVARFEANTIASGKTSRSTAKVTVAHGFKYAELQENSSPEISRKYAAANMDGLRFFAGLLGKRERRDMYLYSLYGQRRLRKEFAAMTENGIPCEYPDADLIPLPFPVEGAIKLPDQYAINPVRFCHSLCRFAGFRIFENSPAEIVDEHLLVCGGYKINANQIAVCTNYPLHTPSFKAPLKLSRKTSSAVKMRREEGFPIPQNVMAYGADGGYGYRYSDDPQELIVSGETTRGAPTPLAEERLASAVWQFAPGAVLTESWTNNDTYTHDGVPYSGMLSSGIWVACGYSAWGMTNSAAMAIVTADQICGREPWYADAFSPRRNFLRGGAIEFSEHIQTAVGGVVKQMSSAPGVYPGEVKTGQAETVVIHGRRAGAYRDDKGEVHLVSLKCPHLGCSLEWNPTDKTWDCPCHGSRFSYTGECLTNPANRGIKL